MNNQLAKELRQVREEIRRVESNVRKLSEQLSGINEKMNEVVDGLHSQFEVLSERTGEYNSLVEQIDDVNLRALLRISPAPSNTAPKTGPTTKEKTKWVYEQVKRAPKKTSVLQKRFAESYALPAGTLDAFLKVSKYFRKSGAAPDFHWSVSANRKNDLLDYLNG